MTWYNNSWNYRKTITISNSGSLLTDYQVLVIVDTANLISSSKMRSDCGDIRLTDTDGSTLLNYWIESGINSASTRIWIKIPSISSGSKTIYIYYNNPTAISLSNGTNTYLFFDEFDDYSTTDITEKGKWSKYTTGNAYVDINNGKLRCDSNSIQNGVAYATAIPQFSSGIHIETSASIPTNGDRYHTLGFNSGYNYPATNNSQINIAFDYTITESNWHLYSVKAGVNSSEVAVGGDANYHTFKLIYEPNKIEWLIDGVSKKTETNTAYIPNVSMPLDIGAYRGTANAIVYMDWIRIRKYTSPEPTTCVGGEEVPTVSWLTNWNRRKLITITGSTSSQTDYQMKLTVHRSTGTDTSTDIYLGTNVNNDFGDLRFTTNNGTTILNYWTESYTSGSVALVWIKIPSIPIGPCTTTIYIYYNKSGESTTSNGTITFVDFDDFNDLTGWTQQAAAWTVSGGALQVPDTGDALGYLRRNTTNPLNTDYIARLRLKIEESTIYESNHRLWLLLNSPNPLLNTAGNSICWYEKYKTTFQNRLTHDYSGTPTATTISAYPAYTWLKSEVRISETEDKITLWSDDLVTNYGSHTTTNTKDGGNYWGFLTSYSKGQVDWILIRKYTSPEPTFSSIGTEEVPTTPANITATNLTITPYPIPCISESCTVTVDVIWTNTGGTSGSFTPSIKIDTVPVVVDPPLSPVSVGPSLTASQQFVISGLTTGTHNICPDPN